MNRLKGVTPDYCSKIVWSEEERLYLEKMARSRRPFDRDLCLRYVGAGIHSVRNRRLMVFSVGVQWLPWEEPLPRRDDTW
jgi:hypothetical protein